MCGPSFNPFKPNGIAHYYQLDQSISVLRVVRLYFFIFIQISIEHSVRKQWRSCSAVSDLDLHCLPMSFKINPLSFFLV